MGTPLRNGLVQRLAQVARVWCGRPAIRSTLMLAIPALRKAANIVVNFFASVQSPDLRSFVINKRLHA